MILKIVIPVLVVLVCYYAGLFIYYYRKKGSFKMALRNTFILLLPLILFFFIVEFCFRVVVSNKIMKQDHHFFTSNFATAYYLVYPHKLLPQRYIRLREPQVNLNMAAAPPRNFLPSCENLKDTIYTLRTDSNGFILPEETGKKHTLCFVGGSTTQCHYVQETNRFPYLVGRLLNDRGMSFTTKNAGYSGNNTMHSVNNLINKILPQKPDVVVLMEAINDLSILIWEESYYNANPTRSLVVDENLLLKDNGMAEQVDEFFEKKSHPGKVDTGTIFNEYRSALLLFINVCRSQKIKPVLMTQFNRMEYNQINKCKKLAIQFNEFKTAFPQIDYIALYKRMNNIIRETASSEQVPLIDLDSLVPKSERYIYDAVHLNDSGSIYVANIVAGHLSRYLRPANDTLKRL